MSGSGMSRRPTRLSLGPRSTSTWRRRGRRRRNHQSTYGSIFSRSPEMFSLSLDILLLSFLLLSFPLSIWCTFSLCLFSLMVLRNRGLQPHKRKVRLERDGKMLNVNEARSNITINTSVLFLHTHTGQHCCSDFNVAEK